MKRKINNNKISLTPPYPRGEGGVKGKGELQVRGAWTILLLLILHLRVPILRPLNIKTKNTYFKLLRTGVDPPPPFTDMSVKNSFFYAFPKVSRV